ncbi:peptidase C65 Otubain-domain-containing protein [Endogone sp. FLAS-F59071]|nr:peptidase C65 Otubain-domain-containing protein [Endogone sp. FLAS-F59071]|eukprot:RUS22152.1 peptidase C65 Otubain-domain-containing protein [Endogone sp. FLAS-F59071]
MTEIPNQDQQREPELTDQQILDFEQKIKDEQAQKIPLVCQVEPIAKLLEEFEGNTQSFQNKIKVGSIMRNLWPMTLLREHVFRTWQPTTIGSEDVEAMETVSIAVALPFSIFSLPAPACRCLSFLIIIYHLALIAFAFAWFESLLLDPNPETLNRAVKTLKSTPDLLLNAGFQQLVIEDFYDVTLEQLQLLPQRRDCPDDLLAAFQSDEVSNTIVMHFRFVTSAYLKYHAAEYEPFLLVEMVSIDEFCSSNVEAFGRESDQYQIIALTKALGVPVEVAYLDGTSGENVTFHEFWPDEADKARGVKPLKLIYRPGHYDILYERS